MYVVAEVVAGLSKKLALPTTNSVAIVLLKPNVERDRLPAASPIFIAVESLTILKNNDATPVSIEPETCAITKILLVAELGVMLTLSPVISAKVVLVLVKVSVFDVLTTCRIFPTPTTACTT